MIAVHVPARRKTVLHLFKRSGNGDDFSSSTRQRGNRSPSTSTRRCWTWLSTWSSQRSAWTSSSVLSSEASRNFVLKRYQNGIAHTQNSAELLPEHRYIEFDHAYHHHLHFKAVVQTLLCSHYTVLWPSIPFGHGHHGAKLLECLLNQLKWTSAWR